MPRPTPRSARLGIRATPEQEAILKRAAEARHKSLTEFILDSACSAAEQTLLDQRLFVVPGGQWYRAQRFVVEPDASSASYFAAAAALVGGTVRL